MARQSQSRIRCHSPLAMDYLVDTAGMDVEVFGQAVLANTIRLEKLFKEHLSGMNRGELIAFHGFT